MVVADQGTSDEDDDAIWLERASEEDLRAHAEEVRRIMLEHDVSPPSSPPADTTPTRSSLHDGVHAEEEREPEREARGAGAIGIGDHDPELRRASSALVDIIAEGKDAAAQDDGVEHVEGVMFRKLVDKHGKGMKLPEPPSDANDIVHYGDPGDEEEEGDDVLVSGALMALAQASDVERAWLRPKRAPAIAAPAIDAPDGSPDNLTKFGNYNVSRASWLGSLSFHIPQAEGSATILAARRGAGRDATLAVGTSSGSALVFRIPSLMDPWSAPNVKCEPPPAMPGDKGPMKITAMDVSFGTDAYVAVGYANGAIAVHDVSSLAEGQSATDVPATKVIRQPEHRDAPITALAFAHCRHQAESSGSVPDSKKVSQSIQGTAKAAIGAMGIGYVFTLISCDASGTICTHALSVVAPGMRMLRRSPVVSITSKFRQTLGSAIYHCSVLPITRGAFVALLSPAEVTLLRINLRVGSEIDGIVLVGKVAAPSSSTMGALPVVSWSRGLDESKEPKFVVCWNRTARLVAVGGASSANASTVSVIREWIVDNHVVGLHWIDGDRIIAISEQGHISILAASGDSIAAGSEVGTLDSILMQESPIRQTLAHDRSFYGSSQALQVSSDAEFGVKQIEGHSAVAVVGRNGSIAYSMLLSRPSRARVLFSRYAGKPHYALVGAIEMLKQNTIGSEARYLREEIIRILDASMKSNLETGEYDLAARDVFDACMAIAENELVSGHVSSFDESEAISKFLWQEAFQSFSAIQSETCLAAFTNALENAIMKAYDGDAGAGQSSGFERMLRVPPEVMQKLVESLSSQPERIESCVVRMPIMCLDFNQIARLCTSNGLHSAFAYLYNQGLGDAMTPAIEMMKAIQKAQGQDAKLGLLRKFAVYVACTFKGQKYPPADLSVLSPGTSSSKHTENISTMVEREEKLHLVRTQMLKFLLFFPQASLHKDGSMPAHGLSGPVLRGMLSIDTDLTLSLLLCAFEVWDSLALDVINAEGLPMERGVKGSSEEDDRTALQLSVDVLSKEAELSEQTGSVGIANAGCIWMFIAYQVSIGRARLGSKNGNELLARVLEHLCLASKTVKDATKHNAFERASLRLVEAWWSANNSVEHSERIMVLANQSHMYLLCARVQMYLEHYQDAVAYLIRHVEDGTPAHDAQAKQKRSGTTFRVLAEILSVKGPSQHKAKGAVTSKLKALTTIDAGRTAELIGTIQPKGVDGASRESQELQNRSGGMEEGFVLVEHYIEALCQINPEAVLPFLQRNEGQYRLGTILHMVLGDNDGDSASICCDDAAVYVLERLGDIHAALDVFLAVIKNGLYAVSKALVGRQKPKEACNVHDLPEALAVKDILTSALGLCYRNSKLMGEEEGEDMWFQILAIFLYPARDVKNAASDTKDESVSQTLSAMQAFLSTLTKVTLVAMADAMKLSVVAKRLVEKHSGSSLSSFRDTIVAMLEACGREVGVLSTAKKVIDTQAVLAREAIVAQRRRRVKRVEMAPNPSHAHASTKKPWSSDGPGRFQSLSLAPPPGSELYLIGTGNRGHLVRRKPSSLPRKATVEVLFALSSDDEY